MFMRKICNNLRKLQQTVCLKIHRNGSLKWTHRVNFCPGREYERARRLMKSKTLVDFFIITNKLTDAIDTLRHPVFVPWRLAVQTETPIGRGGSAKSLADKDGGQKKDADKKKDGKKEDGDDGKAKKKEAAKGGDAAITSDFLRKHFRLD